MTNLYVDLYCESKESELSMRSFLETLSKGIKFGLFLCANYSDLSAIRFLGVQRDNLNLRMSIAIPDIAVVDPNIVESLFLPVLDSSECPCALKGLFFNPPRAFGGSLDSMSFVHNLVLEELISLPDEIDHTQPISIWIDFSMPLNIKQKEFFRQSLDLFEELIATAPFLSCSAKDYSGIGQTQLNWLGNTKCQYWIEAIATHALWVPMLANILFRNVVFNGGKQVSIEQ